MATARLFALILQGFVTGKPLAAENGSFVNIY
jgi:hypothetical protein